VNSNPIHGEVYLIQHYVIKFNSYSIPRWRTAISCGQCRISKMIYYTEMHWHTLEKLTWLKGKYYIENPSIRFMVVIFQYYCIGWMSKLSLLKIKHHKIMMTDQFECAFMTGFRDKTRIILLYLMQSIIKQHY
jgi:hypothetical protein